MLKLSIRQKILIAVLAVTVLPVTVLNIYWITKQRSTILQNSETFQHGVTNDDADDVNTFLGSEIQELTARSQSLALVPTSTAQAGKVLEAMLAADPNLLRASITNSTGQEVVAEDAGGVVAPLENDAQTPAFESVGSGLQNQFLSSGTLASSGQPQITVAVPIVAVASPKQLSVLATQSSRPAKSPLVFAGALIAQVNSQALWTQILSQSINDGAPGSYAYVVDNKGNAIAYPQSSQSLAKNSFANVPIVRDFISNIGHATDAAGDQAGSLVGASEKGQDVLATYQKLGLVNWAIVNEDPTSDVYKSINEVTLVGSGIGIAAILILFIICFYLSGFFTRPVLRIAQVADRIGRGEFDTRVEGSRSDEIGTLGQSINTMGENLKQSIGRIEDQSRQVEAILNNTTDAIMSVDEESRIMIANSAAATFFESSREILARQDVRALLGQVKSSKPVSLDFKDLAPGANVFSDLTYVSLGQSTHFIDIIAYKIQGSNGITSQAIITIHDETKRRELDKLKIDFVSMAAHELRTPLSAVSGYLELISEAKKHAKLPQNIQEYIDHAQMSVRELGSLMSNLLSVTRLEHGTLHLQMEKVDLADKVRNTVKNCQFNAAAKGVELAYEGPEDERFVVADPITLQEVINNLIDNAIKYTPEKGKVTVSLTSDKSSYTFKVSDTGIGIPEDAIPHLFTKFFRVHNGLETGSAGTGLGLFLAKTILQSYEGTISVESELGKGTSFTVTLPVFNEEHYHQIIGSQPDDAFKNGGRRGWATKNTPR